MFGKIKIESTGNINKQGIGAKSNKPYFMCQAYMHIPGVPYPQEIEYFASTQNEVLPAGSYEVDVFLTTKDKRPEFTFDVRQSRRISTPAPQQAPKAVGSN